MKQAAAEAAPVRGNHQLLIIPALPDIMRSPTSLRSRPAALSAPWLCIIARSALSAYCGSLQYAQFERELISERTRDKMAAARRKGKWVGGCPPLGYDVAAGGGRLVVNEAEAEIVREIFSLYLERQSVLAVCDELNRRGRTTKQWTSRRGRVHAILCEVRDGSLVA